MAKIKNRYNRVAQDEQQLQQFVDEVCNVLGEDLDGIDVVELTSLTGVVTNEQFKKLSKDNCVIKLGTQIYYKVIDSIYYLVYQTAIRHADSSSIFEKIEIEKATKAYEYKKLSVVNSSDAEEGLVLTADGEGGTYWAEPSIKIVEDLPVSGETGKLYIVKNTNARYRWDEDAKKYVRLGHITLSCDDMSELSYSQFAAIRVGDMIAKEGSDGYLCVYSDEDPTNNKTFTQLFDGSVYGFKSHWSEDTKQVKTEDFNNINCEGISSYDPAGKKNAPEGYVLESDGEGNTRWAKPSAKIVENVTYAELLTLMENAQLIAGMTYCITDYFAVQRGDFRSAEKPLLVYLKAESSSKLSAKGFAIPKFLLKPEYTYIGPSYRGTLVATGRIVQISDDFYQEYRMTDSSAPQFNGYYYTSPSEVSYANSVVFEYLRNYVALPKDRYSSSPNWRSRITVASVGDDAIPYFWRLERFEVEFSFTARTSSGNTLRGPAIDADGSGPFVRSPDEDYSQEDEPPAEDYPGYIYAWKSVSQIIFTNSEDPSEGAIAIDPDGGDSPELQITRVYEWSGFRGEITWMKDPRGNEAPFDFSSVMFSIDKLTGTVQSSEYNDWVTGNHFKITKSGQTFGATSSEFFAWVYAFTAFKLYHERMYVVDASNYGLAQQSAAAGGGVYVTQKALFRGSKIKKPRFMTSRELPQVVLIIEASEHLYEDAFCDNCITAGYLVAHTALKYSKVIMNSNSAVLLDNVLSADIAFYSCSLAVRGSNIFARGANTTNGRLGSLDTLDLQDVNNFKLVGPRETAKYRVTETDNLEIAYCSVKLQVHMPGMTEIKMIGLTALHSEFVPPQTGEKICHYYGTNVHEEVL